jgi:hypothetical protein
MTMGIVVLVSFGLAVVMIVLSVALGAGIEGSGDSPKRCPG